MKVTGIDLQQAVREAREERDMAAARFNPSLTAFPDDEKPSPAQIAERFVDSEIRLARLQVAQTRYNMAVTVSVNGDQMTLLEAIKRVGGAGRLEQMWRAAASENADRYGYHDVRNKDVVVAKRQVTYDEANENRKASGKFAASLRAAIQKGNAVEIDVSSDVNL